MNTMRRIIPVLVFSLAVTMVAAGCVYYNMFFNAKKKFDLAERQNQSTTGRQKGGKFQTGYRGYEDAITHFSKVIDRHPKSKWVDDAYYYIGLSYFRMAEYEKSQRSFREILDNHPKSKYIEEATFWIALGRMYSGELAAGRQMLRKLAHSAKKNRWRAMAWYELGEMFYGDQQYDSAVSAYLAVAENYPGVETTEDARFKAGEALILSGQGQKALEQFLITLKEEPSEDLVYQTRMRMADAYFDFGEIDSGLVLLRSLAKSDVYFDSLGVVELNIGWGLEQAGRFEEAISTYENLTATFPKSAWSAEAYYRIGYIHQKEYFDFPAAREFYQKSKEEYSRSEYAKKAINLSVTLATIEGYQQEIAAYLQGGLDSTAAVDSNTVVDTLSSIDPSGDRAAAIVDGNAVSDNPPPADSTAIDESGSLGDTAPEMDSGAAMDTATVTDTLNVPESYAAIDSLPTAGSLSAPDSTESDNETRTGETVSASDSLQDAAVVEPIEFADIYSSEMPRVDTSLVIDTNLVYDTLYVLDTIMAPDAELIFALRSAEAKARASVTPEIMDSSAADTAVGDSSRGGENMIPVGMIPAVDSTARADTVSAVDSAFAGEVPAADTDSEIDTIPGEQPVLSTDSTRSADTTMAVLAASDTSRTADSTIVDEPTEPKPAVTVVDTMLFIDTLLSINTTLTFDTVRAVRDVPAADTVQVSDSALIVDDILAADTLQASDMAAAIDQILAVDTTRTCDTSVIIDTTFALVSVPATDSTPAFGSMLIVDTTVVFDSAWVVDTTYVIDDAALAAYRKKKEAREKVATAYYKLAEAFYQTLDVPDSALFYYDALVAKFPESEHVPRALFAAGSILEDNLKDSVNAAKKYREVLGKYGRTDYAGAAIQRLGLTDTPGDTGYPAAYFRDAERLLLEGNHPDSARAMFASIAREFPKSYYAPKAAYASVVVAEHSMPREDSSLYFLYKAFIDSFPGTPYAVAAKEMLGSESSAPKRQRAVIDEKTGTGDLDSAMDAIQAEQGDTTVIQWPWAPRPEVAGIFNYPESEMGVDPWQGRVVFKIWIDFTGKIAEYEMIQPSDRPDIDVAATQAVEGTHFNPDSIAAESLNMWYRYEVKVIPRAQQPDNIFNDPLRNTD